MENNVNDLNKTEEKNTLAEKSFLKKLLSREVITYLIFGVLTTLVGWAVYFAIMLVGKAIFAIPSDDTESGAYFALYTVAQIIQWVCAVLFAFLPTENGCLPMPIKQKIYFCSFLPLREAEFFRLDLIT